MKSPGLVPWVTPGIDVASRIDRLPEFSDEAGGKDGLGECDQIGVAEADALRDNAAGVDHGRNAPCAQGLQNRRH
jgi:hypothetical protein